MQQAGRRKHEAFHSTAGMPCFWTRRLINTPLIAEGAFKDTKLLAMMRASQTTTSSEVCFSRPAEIVQLLAMLTGSSRLFWWLCLLLLSLVQRDFFHMRSAPCEVSGRQIDSSRLCCALGLPLLNLMQATSVLETLNLAAASRRLFRSSQPGLPGSWLWSAMPSSHRPPLAFTSCSMLGRVDAPTDMTNLSNVLSLRETLYIM